MRCCRPRELVSAASSDELFLVLQMLLESIHRFLHQPSALDARMAFSSISFSMMTLVLFNKAVVCSYCSALPTIFALSRSRAAWSFAFLSFSCWMTSVDCSNEAFKSSCNIAHLEI